MPVPLIASKGFRYNRRDIAIDEPFQAVSPQDADILVKARLARRAPELAEPPAAATAAADVARSPTPTPTPPPADTPPRARRVRTKRVRAATSGGPPSTATGS